MSLNQNKSNTFGSTISALSLYDDESLWKNKNKNKYLTPT